jgi:hypothetical protein
LLNWQDILNIRISDDSLRVEIGPLLLFVMLAVLVYLWKRGSRQWRNYETVSVDLSFAAIGKVTIKPNHEVAQIAHQVWAELVTRKAGLQVDETHDVIVEVYDSWYQLFGRIRESLRSVPAQLMRSDENTRKLVSLLVDALNKGLRPHLTRWQARFRHWYADELKRQPDKSPQEIQKQYPQYVELLADLQAANKQVIELSRALESIAHGRQTKVK